MPISPIFKDIVLKVKIIRKQTKNVPTIYFLLAGA